MLVLALGGKRSEEDREKKIIDGGGASLLWKNGHIIKKVLNTGITPQE